MVSGRCRFNLNLCFLGMIAVALCGCRTTESRDEQLATLQLHIEVMPDARDFSVLAPIYRKKPVNVRVDREPFLSEGNVSEAKIVDEPEGFSLQIQFDRRGSWLLEQYTTVNPGKHVAIFSEFGPRTNIQKRWLGAPVITRRISNGLLTFTPDATREESEDIVLGLNNLARIVEEKSKW